MKIDKKIVTRLEELISRGEEIGRSFKSHRGGSFSFNSAAAVQWKVSCISFLKTVFGDENTYPKEFDDYFDISTDSAMISFEVIVSVVRAAKEDYENDYLFNVRTLIEAEIFDDFLDQAEQLLVKGYFTAAAVIGGSVLEDGLRKLCSKNGMTLPAKPKLDSMNSDLAKAGVYNLLKQKQITALADLRNKAAHGLGGFTKNDVESMIKDVRRFMEDFFS